MRTMKARTNADGVCTTTTKNDYVKTSMKNRIGE
jgi:hypothetical protein